MEWFLANSLEFSEPVSNRSDISDTFQISRDQYLIVIALKFNDISQKIQIP